MELLQNSLTVALYVYLGYSIFGLQLAFMVNALVMVILGVVAWFMLPSQTLLKTDNNARQANQEVLAGMKLTLRLPEVWLAGTVGFCVYFVYTAMPYFVTYLDEMYVLPALAISIFGIASTSGGRIAVAFPSGFIAGRFFGGAVGGLGGGFALILVLGLAMVWPYVDRGCALVSDGLFDGDRLRYLFHARPVLCALWGNGVAATLLWFRDRHCFLYRVSAVVLRLPTLGVDFRW